MQQSQYHRQGHDATIKLSLYRHLHHATTVSSPNNQIHATIKLTSYGYRPYFIIVVIDITSHVQLAIATITTSCNNQINVILSSSIVINATILTYL